MKRNAKHSRLEELFAAHMANDGIAAPVREYRFCDRQWRFDFAWPDLKLAAEIEGGTWAGGRHVRPDGFAADCRKYNRAALEGWRVLRFTGGMVETGQARRYLQAAMLEFE